MLRSSQFLLAASVLAGALAIPAVAQAGSTKSDKSEAVNTAQKSQASVDEFEENRRAHMQKSKENNEKKGAE